MNGTKRAQQWSVLLLLIMTTLSLGGSVSRPMPHEGELAPSEEGLTPSLQTSSREEDASNDDFIDPQRFRTSSARPPARPSVAESPAAADTPLSYSMPIVPGRAVRLDPVSPLNVPLSGQIEFVATLINIQTSDWRVIGELYVAKGDGTTEKLFGPRSIRLGRAQTLRLPVGFAATSPRFPPGPTQFIAILRDQAGQIIDQATVTFSIELGH